jgi:uncharacterized membrane protein
LVLGLDSRIMAQNSSFAHAGATALFALTALTGCASAPPVAATEESVVESATEREARCSVTGSNLRKRDCRGEVQIIAPSSVDLRPGVPSGAPRN